MQKKIPVIIGLISAIFIVSCRWQQTEKSTSTNTSATIHITPSSVATIHISLDDFDFQKALRLMLESPDMVFSSNSGLDTIAINTAAEWTGFSGANPCNPFPTPSSSTNLNRFECTKILLAEPYFQHGKDQILMLTETINSECHPCSPNITIAIFQKQAEDVILVSKQSDISSIGSWGHAPPAELIQIGQNRFGILFRHNNTSSGISIGEIILVSEVMSEFQVIFREQTALRYLEEGWGYESEVVFMEDAEHDWYEIQIIATGIKPTSTTQSDVEPFEEVKWFIWDGDSYTVSESK